MEQAERKKLLDYIKTAIDVEKDIETQNQIGIQYQTWITQKEPVLCKLETPNAQYRVKPESGFIGLCFFVESF